MSETAAWRYCPHCGAQLAPRQVDGAERLACGTPDCGFVHWDNPTPVVAALVECIDRGGSILLARNHAWPEKTFGLITGFLERCERPEDAVAREIREELALATESLALIGLYPFERKNQILICYHARARGEVRLNHELAEYRLIPREKLQAWDYGTGLAVRDWLAALSQAPQRME